MLFGESLNQTHTRFEDDENTHSLTITNSPTEFMAPCVTAAPELMYGNLSHAPLFLVLVSMCVTIPDPPPAQPLALGVINTCHIDTVTPTRTER